MYICVVLRNNNVCESCVSTSLRKCHAVIVCQDERLKILVDKHGEDWKLLSAYFPDRTDVQCQHRWHKVVNPELVKGPWTKEVRT